MESVNTNHLTEFLQSRLDPALEMLQRMVAINSFTANPDGVNRLGRLTADCFAELGFTADFVPSVNSAFGDHLVLTRRGRSNRTVGLVSHLDTVFPPEEEVRNHFSWRRDGDRIYGPGTLDIKGGTAMIHMILSALREANAAAFDDVTWIILLNSSEEVLSVDFGRLCHERMGKDALAALVFEAGRRRPGNEWTLVTARKGRATFRMSVEGRGAHAGSQHKRGANAVVQIAETIHRVAQLTDYSKDLTFNVGSVTGGTVVNRVPHSAAAEIEMRAFNVEAYNAGMNAILALNGQATVRSAEDGHPCRVTIEVNEETPPWPKNAGTDRLFELWKRAAEPLGMRLTREERGGISDGNYLWQTIPTVDGLGPDGDNAHCSEQSPDGSKQQEFVDATSFVPKAALSVEAILKLIG